MDGILVVAMLSVEACDDIRHYETEFEAKIITSAFGVVKKDTGSILWRKDKPEELRTDSVLISAIQSNLRHPYLIQL